MQDSKRATTQPEPQGLSTATEPGVLRERGLLWVNDGEPPITGRTEKGSRERKEKCEDAKIRDSQSGLFMIADGVSTAVGEVASRITGTVVFEELGLRLDEEITNLAGRDTEISEKIKSIDGYVRSRIATVLKEADQKIKSETDRRPATTVSFSKVVEMPDSSIRMYYTNIGDSRIYMFREGKLMCLTKDDNELTYYVQKSEKETKVAEGTGKIPEDTITRAMARIIDQADSVEGLAVEMKSKGYNDDQVWMAKYFFRSRNVVTKSIGHLSVKDTIDVKVVRLLPGDRLVIASDGLSDQMKEDEIAKRLLTFPDDIKAERDLQQAADEIVFRAESGRAKADDIAVIVKTIETREKTNEKQTEPVIEKSRVEAWRVALPALEHEVYSMREAVRAADTDTVQGIEQIIALKQKEVQLASLEYWIAKAEAIDAMKNIPRMFEPGENVRIYRKDTDPPGFDRIQWKVTGYDGEQDRYLIAHPTGTKRMMVERFMLELWQKSDTVQPGDLVTLPAEDSGKPMVYRVVGIEDEKMVLLRQLKEGLVRRVEDSAMVNEEAKSIYILKRKAVTDKRTVYRLQKLTEELNTEINKLTQKREETFVATVGESVKGRAKT